MSIKSKILDECIKRGLYVGRFQPLHIGHVTVITELLKKVDELIIIIGSSQKSHELDNPFTSGERIMMIRAALNEVGIDPSKYYLIPVPDAQYHSVWVSYIVSQSPSFDIVYSNDPLTRILFKEAGITVERIPFIKRSIYSATEVRRRILDGEDWKKLLPNCISELIISIKGVERLKELAATDSPF